MMTKKAGSIIFAAIAALLLSLCTHADMMDIYKKGEIKLVPDPGFGKGMDWEEMFYDLAKRVSIAPDGSIFVSNIRQHNIQKFDKSGKLLLTFGQKGQGPGDFINPGDISILDDKYLIVRENNPNRRISLFDLKGKFVRIIKNKNFVFHCVALKNNKLALNKFKYLNEYDRTKDLVTIVEIYILDINTGQEVFLTSSRLKMRIKKFGNKKRQRSFREDYFLRRTKDGNLLVGFASKNKICIYNPLGKEINSFNLNIERKKFTPEIRQKRVEHMIKGMEGDTRFPKKMRDSNVKYFKSNRKEVMADTPEYFYSYYDLKIDGDGNILVLLNNKTMSGYDENWVPVYRVYTSEGVFIGEVKIDFGPYKPISFLNNFKEFFGNNLVGLFERRDSDDIVIELLKMHLK